VPILTSEEQANAPLSDPTDASSLPGDTADWSATHGRKIQAYMCMCIVSLPWGGEPRHSDRSSEGRTLVGVYSELKQMAED
jgi:hypothetical protein